MITTNHFNLTPNQLFKVLLSWSFGRTIWKIYPFIYAFILFVVFVIAPVQRSFDIFMVIFLAALPALLVVVQWFHTRSADNKAFYTARQWVFEADKMRAISADGSEGTIMLSTLIRYVERKKYYLLFVSKNQFHYIPKDCFQSAEDLKWFEEVVLMKLKK